MAERPRRAAPVCGAWMPPAASAGRPGWPGRPGPPRGAARRRNGARGHRTRYCRHILY